MAAEKKTWTRTISRSPKEVTQWHRDIKSNKTGFLGVKKKRSRFDAYIRIPGSSKKLYCGSGSTAEEAARKYDLKAREIYGPEAVTNFQKP